MTRRNDLEEVEVVETDDYDDDDEMDDDTKLVLAFGAGLVLAYAYLTRPRGVSKADLYAADLARARGE